MAEKRAATAKDWDRIRALYLRNESLDYILEEMKDVKLNKQVIMNKMSAEGITTKKKALQDKITDHLVSVTEAEKIACNEKCIKMFNDGSKVIDLLLKQYIGEAKQGDIPKTKAKATAYNVDLLMSGVTKIQKGLRVAYGMDDNGKLYEKEPEVLVIEGVDVGKI